MKRYITIIVIVLLALGLGYYLYSISDQQTVGPADKGSWNDFNTTKTADITEPRQVGNDDYVLGNRSAANTMVIYEDFECPACANYAPIAEQFPTALRDTKLVFRHYPLPQHKNAVSAAYAAEAAGKQGKFWEMYRVLYTTQDQWAGLQNPADKLAELAGTAGVPDLNAFKSDMQNKVGKDKIQADITEAASLRVSGTPTLYFNGKSLQLGSLDNVKAQAEKLYK